MSSSLKVSYKVSIIIHYLKLNVKVNLKRNWTLFSANTKFERVCYINHQCLSVSLSLANLLIRELILSLMLVFLGFELGRAYGFSYL